MDKERKEYGEMLDRVRSEIGRCVVGQEALINRMMLGLLCNGHVLLEGVPRNCQNSRGEQSGESSAGRIQPDSIHS